MNLQPAFILTVQSSNRYYELGQTLRERGPEIIEAATRPAYLTLAVVAVALCAFGALVLPRLSGPLIWVIYRFLYAEPGVLLGYTPARWGFTLPVYLGVLDRLMHTQAVAPTGMAKTSLFEWIYCQDLHSGLTGLCVENVGNFGEKATSRALLAGKPVYLFDPTIRNTLKWNPLSGAAEEVASLMVTTFESSARSGKEEFFKSFQSTLLRHAILALKAYERRDLRKEPAVREINMSDLWRFLNDPRFRNDTVLDVSSSGGEHGGRLRVTARGLPDKTRMYFEGRYFGAWTRKQREEFTAGLFSEIDTLLGSSVIERALCPEPGEPTLNLAEALDSGGFVLLSVPQEHLRKTYTRTLSIWLMMSTIDALRRRGRGARPVSVFIDEAHSMLGHASSDAATEFRDFLPNARHYNAMLQLCYQSFSLLPPELRAALSSNARTKFLGGGLGPLDAKEGQEIMGFSEEVVTDRRRTYRSLFSFGGTYSVGSREMERPNLTEEEIRLLRRGWWYVRRVRNGNDRPPVLVKAGRAPALPVTFEPERVTVLVEEEEEKRQVVT